MARPSSIQLSGEAGLVSRLIFFDKRGTGLSDRAVAVPTLEERMDDVRAVMDAARSARAALFGVSEGGQMCALFAATHPERTAALVMYAGSAKRLWAPDHPWAPTPERRQEFFDAIENDWGGVVDFAIVAPSVADDPGFQDSWAAYLRMGASPGAALALARMNTEIDIRAILPTIRVPTLILHRTGDLDMHIEEGRYLASEIPGATFVELAGADHLWWVGDIDALLDEVEEFLTGVPRGVELERVLATVLFMDIVGSTELLTRLGDRRWQELLEGYHGLARRELSRFRGLEVDTAGDGLLATFDGRARAIRCAAAISAGAGRLDWRSGQGLTRGSAR